MHFCGWKWKRTGSRGGSTIGFFPRNRQRQKAREIPRGNLQLFLNDSWYLLDVSRAKLDLNTFFGIFFGVTGTILTLVGLCFTYKHRQSIIPTVMHIVLISLLLLIQIEISSMWSDFWRSSHWSDLPLYHSHSFETPGQHLQHRRAMYVLLEETVRRPSKPDSLENHRFVS